MIIRPLHTGGALFFVIPATFLFAGCSGEPAGMVTGKVKLDGKLMSMGTVTFENSQNRAIKSTPIGQDGTYSISIAPGPCKITVTAPAVGGMPEGMKMDPSKMGAAGKTPVKAPEAVEVPSKYTSMQSTTLSFIVEAGQKNFDIEMKAEPKVEP